MSAHTPPPLPRACRRRGSRRSRLGADIRVVRRHSLVDRILCRYMYIITIQPSEFRPKNENMISLRRDAGDGAAPMPHAAMPPWRRRGPGRSPCRGCAATRPHQAIICAVGPYTAVGPYSVPSIDSGTSHASAEATLRGGPAPVAPTRPSSVHGSGGDIGRSSARHSLFR